MSAVYAQGPRVDSVSRCWSRVFLAFSLVSLLAVADVSTNFTLFQH